MKLTDKINVFAFFTTNSERSTIAMGSVSSFLIQIGFAGLSFITTTVLVHLLGIESYGAYSNAIAWVNILAALGLFGLNSLLLREMAVLKARNNWALVKGFLQFSDRLIVVISIFLMLFLWGVACILFSVPEKESFRLSLWFAAPLIPLYALINLRQSGMRGLQQVTRAMLPDFIIRPALILVGIFGVNLLLPNLINVQAIMALSIVVAMIALMISARWLRNMLPEGFSKIQPQYQISEWVKVAPPMFVIGAVQILIAQAPIIMLGMISNAQNVGYFAVASRVANLLLFLPMAVGIVLGPRIASLYAQGEKLHLQKLLKKTNRLTFAVTFFLGVLFILFAKNILSIFGPGFQIVQGALVLLTIGYLVDTGFGLSIITLMMTGNERVVAVYQAVFAIVLLVLSALMIPAGGYESAALVFMTVMIISRLVFTYVARKKTGINTTIF